MRQPSQPRRPRNIGHGQTERDSGGELARRRPVEPSIHDHIPTAPLPAGYQIDDVDEVQPEPTREEKRREASSRRSSSASEFGAGVYVSDPDDDAPGAFPEYPEGILDQDETPEADVVEKKKRFSLRRGKKTDETVDVEVPSRGVFDRIADRVSTKPTESKIASINERRKERAAERRKVLFKRVGIWGSIIAVLAIAVWAAAFSPILTYDFAKTSLSGVGGTSIVPKAEVDAVLKAHEGDNLLRLDEGKIEEELEKIPEVASASVSSKLPTGLKVSVTARVPVACVTVDKKCQATSADGVALRVPAETVDTLPTLGQLPEGADQQASIETMLKVLEVLSPETRAIIDTVEVSKTGQVTLKAGKSRQIFWGEPTENEAKGRVLDRLIKLEVRYIDVSVPDAPVTSQSVPAS